MKAEYYEPIWVKTLLGFGLMIIGLLMTFLVYRFIPVPKLEGYDGFRSVLLTLLGLGAVELFYIVGVMFSKNHPYVIFTLCMVLFILGLVGFRIFMV